MALQISSAPNLEILLSSTFVMHPSRVSSLVKDVMQMIEKDTASFSTFLQGFDERAKLKKILGPNSNWKSVLTSHDEGYDEVAMQPEDRNGIKRDTHAYYLTTFFPTRRTTQNLHQDFFSSAFELIKVIRDKLVHFKDFPENIKRVLKWATESSGIDGVEFVLRDDLWLKYWNLRFPKLLSFVWMEFYAYRDRLCKYYPLNLDKSKQHWDWDYTPYGFATILSRAFEEDLARCGLDGYFINEQQNIKLDFRHLTSTLVSIGPYEGSSAVYVRFTRRDFTIVFVNLRGEQTELNYPFPNIRKSLSVITKLTERELCSDLLKRFVKSERVIVLLGNPNEKDHLLKEVERSSGLKFLQVAWKDLEKSEKYVILFKQVEVQNKEIQLFTMLPTDRNKRGEILDNLSGQELQNLFQNSIPKVFSGCVLPKTDEIYIERRIVQEVEQEQLNNGTGEINWFQTLEDNTHANLIFLCDKPGQGKTTFTSRFANKTSRFLVLPLTAANLGTWLRQKNIDKESLIDTFSQFFCFTSFQKGVFEDLIAGKVTSKHVLILIDALDEANSESVELILNTLLVLRHDFPTAQVFTTMRVHLFAQTKRKITEATYCRLDSFSDEDKIQYLTKYWNSYIVERYTQDASIPMPIQEQLTEFARKCTAIQVPEEFQDVLGVPLQCRMIAEINAENLLNRNFSLDIHDFGNVTKYFEKYFDSKCEIYFREKNEMSRDDLVNSPLFKRKRKEMLTLHTYYALKLFHRDHPCVDLFRDKYIPQFDKDIETDLLTFGIIKTPDPLEFIHLLIAEYLAAVFYKEFAKEGGIYHSMFSQYKQEYKLQFSKMLASYFNGFARYDESMHEPSFTVERPTVFKFLKCLSEEQSNLVVDPSHVYPSFRYTLFKKFIYQLKVKNAALQKYHAMTLHERNLKFNQVLGDYLTGFTRFGKLIHRQDSGFDLHRPTVVDFLKYLSEWQSNSEVDTRRIQPMCLYNLNKVTLQVYQNRELLPDLVYFWIIEMLNVVQRLWSTAEFCRICIDVTEDKRDWDIYVRVKHME